MLRTLFNEIKTKKRGFTLIELIIVIAIIAILAAIALPKFMDVREKSNVKADIANADNIQMVVATLIADNTISEPIATTGFYVSASTVTVSKLQNVEKVKAKPNKGNEFYVEIEPDGAIKVKTASSGVVVYPNATSTPYNK